MMNGRMDVWRRALRAERIGRWSVRLTLAEARLRQELAWRYRA
ncbi:hypothetical protein SAMN05444336_10763 [Albimonas donghaensis]|uniref:Uncharacterized protein n=1 Tax=Albimonas donghaensis TaxID=356660 RepID=A0A1H3D193_9RHOB|nr:hypothetical protein [Albimonas donghaensis]SDX60060.1 hypothetical protein SAMN05444336_10763 [Albimonas donghaensis]